MIKKNPKNWKKVKSCNSCGHFVGICDNCRKEIKINMNVYCEDTSVDLYDDSHDHFCSKECFVDYHYLSKSKIVWKEVRK